MKNETYQSSGFDIGPEFPLTLAETYSDVTLKSALQSTVSGLKPGMTKWVDADIAKYTGKLAKKPNQSGINPVLIFGNAIVALVCNRNSGTLAQGALTKWYALGTITATVGSTTTLTHAGKFVANEEVGNFVYIVADGGAGGAIPEGDCRLIIKNTTDVLTVQPPFSAAVANTDTAEIFSRSMVIASAGGDARADIAGVVLAPDGIPDNYWGWVCMRGIVGALVTDNVTMAINKAVIAGTGRVSVSNSSAFNLTIGYGMTTVHQHIVTDLVPIMIDVWSVQQTSA